MAELSWRVQVGGRAYLSDPDMFFLREENLWLSQERKEMLSQVDALLGWVFLTSDAPSRYSPEARARYRRLRQAEQVRVEFQGPRPIIRYRLDGEERWLELNWR